MTYRRSGKARGILVLGGAALVAVGLWLGGLFKGPGLGGGNGLPGTTTSSTGTDADKGDPNDLTIEPAPSKPADDDPGDRKGPLHVVMEPDGYSLATLRKDGTTTYAPTTLEEIVAAAPAAEPSPDGYRVMITSRRRVSAGAHLDLVRQLEAAGVDPDEILGYDSLDVAPEETE